MYASLLPSGALPATPASFTRGTASLIDFARGRTHGGGLLGLGVNADQRHSAHSAAAGGNHVAASPQVGLHCFGEGAELLRARLRGEVNQADYAQANADFDDDIDGITRELHAVRSQRGTLDAFLRFAKLMLVDVAAAWQRADAEQRLRVQNFLFQGGVAYHRNQKVFEHR